MQTYSMDGVRQERTSWRDESISKRHRDWGFNCPAVDLDFLMVEYNFAKPVGIVEYKHHGARFPDIKHATYRALITLADMTGLPFVVAFYWPEMWAFRVYPFNETARAHFASPYENLSEFDYVARLYRIRRLSIARELSDKLHTQLPPLSVAAD